MPVTARHPILARAVAASPAALHPGATQSEGAYPSQPPLAVICGPPDACGTPGGERFTCSAPNRDAPPRGQFGMPALPARTFQPLPSDMVAALEAVVRSHNVPLVASRESGMRMPPATVPRVPAGTSVAVTDPAARFRRAELPASASASGQSALQAFIGKELAKWQGALQVIQVKLE